MDLLAKYEVGIIEVDNQSPFPGTDKLKEGEKVLYFHSEYEEILMPVLEINSRLEGW